MYKIFWYWPKLTPPGKKMVNGQHYQTKKKTAFENQINPDYTLAVYMAHLPCTSQLQIYGILER